MQTNGNTEQPTTYDNLDDFFAAALEDEGITPGPCGASRVEKLPMPTVIENDIITGLLD